MSIQSDHASEKLCLKCGITQPRTSFFKCAAKPDGLRSNCKACVKKMALDYMPIHLKKIRERRAKDREKFNAKHREYYQKNIEHLRKKGREFRKAAREKDPDHFHKYERHYFLKKQYNITSQDYDDLLARQNGKCAICGGPPKRKYLYVDHCHVTGSLRSLLCQHCNAALGMAKESREILLKMVEYLDKWHAVHERNPKSSHETTSQTQEPHHAP